MRNHIVKAVAIGTVIMSLAACANYQGQADEGGDSNEIRPLGIDRIDYDRRDNNNRLGINRLNVNRPREIEQDTGMHNNTRIRRAQQIADKIAAMDDVRTANVLLTDNNAYVAVVLENDTDANNNNGANQNANRNGGRTTLENERFHNNRTEFLNNNRNNAFINERRGTTRDNDVTIQLKDRISAQVRRVAPNVNNVYVSANPDFVERMNQYGQRIQDGEPIEGLIEQFNVMVQRIFPTNAGDDNVRVQDRVNMKLDNRR
jgi:YhcN/YlaJ family sporulation lipoprotein